MVRVAVVGVGYWGPNFVRIMDELPDAELVAVCDQDTSRFEKLGNLFPHLKFVDSLDSLLEKEAIDAIVIATSSDTHYEIAHKSLAQGKHVLVEKPLALSSKEAEELDLVRLREEEIASWRREIERKKRLGEASVTQLREEFEAEGEQLELKIRSAEARDEVLRKGRKSMASARGRDRSEI